MELRYRREAAVGLLLVFAAALFVASMLFLKGKSIHPGELVSVSFENVAGLKEGDPVRTAGVTVGSVREVRLDTTGRVAVLLDLSSAPAPHADARASIGTLDFFGARYVEYVPGRSPEPLAAGRVLVGSREQDLSEMAASLAEPARDLLANATELVSPATTRELHALLEQARATVERLGHVGDAPTAELTGALNDLRHLSQRLELLVQRTSDPAEATMRNMEQVTANVATVTATLTRTTATLDSLLTKINTGRGAAGTLINDTTLVTEMRRTNTALSDLLIDIRVNPGRYFRLRL